MQEFKPVAGGWVFHKNDGYKKVKQITESGEILLEDCRVYLAGGFWGITEKYPTLLMRNPFDPDDDPPCDFKVGEVVFVFRKDLALDGWDAFMEYDACRAHPYICSNSCWDHARKLTPSERGE